MKLAGRGYEPYVCPVPLLQTPLARIAYRYSNPLCGYCGTETRRNKDFRVEAWFCCSDECARQLTIDRAW